MSSPKFFPALASVPSDDDTSIAPFTVTRTRGFLPRINPPSILPAAFTSLESLLQRMPLRTASGSPGLLASCALGAAVLAELPDLSTEIENASADMVLMNALYRDYSFLASAYLLEPCHARFVKGEGYGVGRETLPAVIARPIVKVAELAGFKPFMEYAGSYALFNYKLADLNDGLTYDNLRLIRAFEFGLDPMSSEAGFIFVHVDMVKHSGELISGAVDALASCDVGNRKEFVRAMTSVVSAMKKVNKVMEKMWKKSKPNEYTSFRTFIFGITSQSMFPNGVVYEGVSEVPKSFRGESGANDSMIPLCDNLLQIAMPTTPLTEILNDFRSYRPGNHREFLQWVKDRASYIDLKDFALEGRESAALYLQALDQVRDFRWRHWCFTREYILKHTSHPTATGGSPIVTWLPNQLQAVLDAMVEVGDMFEDEPLEGCGDIMRIIRAQQLQLKHEVDKYCKERKT